MTFNESTINGATERITFPAAFAHFVSHIVLGTPQKKMVRVLARRIVTFMTNKLSLRDVTMSQNPAISMGGSASMTINRKSSMPKIAAFTTQPRPAIIRSALFYFLPVSFFNRFYNWIAQRVTIKSQSPIVFITKTFFESRVSLTLANFAFKHIEFNKFYQIILQKSTYSQLSFNRLN